MAKHRWEERSMRVDGNQHDNKYVCINCGYVKTEIKTARHFQIQHSKCIYQRQNESSKKAPDCDKTWPEGWKPQRKYSMFLDDIRKPPVTKGITWIVMRSFDEAVMYIAQHGMPTRISFDHDLGEDVPTGHDLVKWIVDRHLDEIDLLPADFSYTVHSANPPGAANIKGLLDNFLEFLAIQNREDVSG